MSDDLLRAYIRAKLLLETPNPQFAKVLNLIEPKGAEIVQTPYGDYVTISEPHTEQEF